MKIELKKPRLRMIIYLGVLFLMTITALVSSYLINHNKQDVSSKASGTIIQRNLQKHLVAGWNINSSTSIDSAKAIGINSTMFPTSDDSNTLGLQGLLSNSNYDEIDGKIWDIVSQFECHRTWTIALSPSGVNNFCEKDIAPQMDYATTMKAIDDHLSAIETNVVIKAFFILRSWPTWDLNNDIGKKLLIDIRQHIRAVHSESQTLCEFSALVLPQGNYSWIDQKANIFSPEGCDVPILSIVPPLPVHGEVEPSINDFDWTMEKVLPLMFQSLQQHGWDKTRQSFMGKVQTYSGKTVEGDDITILPDTNSIVTQSDFFCRNGANHLSFFTWGSSSVKEPQLPTNNSSIYEGIRQGIEKCQNYWKSNNPVVRENYGYGTTDWLIPWSGYVVADDLNNAIKGYASQTSVNKGEDVTLHVSVNTPQKYSIKIYRSGWYDGKGGSLVYQSGLLQGTTQPSCYRDKVGNLTDNYKTLGLVECKWAESFKVNTTGWTSGIYLGVLSSTAKFQNYVTFVVRDDNRNASLLYQQPVATYQGYNAYPSDLTHGVSLYQNQNKAISTVAVNRAVKVSFDRPYAGSGIGGISNAKLPESGDFFRWEINFIRWMEKTGYDVAYSTSMDTHTHGSMIQRYKGFLSAGHDEYWSTQMYDAIENARNKGTSFAFFGGNDLYWNVRFEPSSDNIPNRIMTSYKNATLDPEQTPSLKTVRWRDDPLNRPEQKFLGVLYNSSLSYTSPAAFVANNTTHWAYENTGLHDNDLVPGIVGHEVDGYVKAYSKPDSTQWTLLSSAKSTDLFNSHSSIYQAPSGAWVFASGTLQWSWALDNFNNRPYVNTGIQKMTENILNKFVGISSVSTAGRTSLTSQSLTPQPTLVPLVDRARPVLTAPPVQEDE